MYYMRKNSLIKSRLNILFGLLNGLISSLQTLWFIPYVKSYLGTTAYGYIAVVNGIVNTLMVISIATGSMSARFIVVELDRKNFKEANKYFNSDLFALIILGAFTSVVGLIITFNLSSVMNVVPKFYRQVQLLFLMTLFSFLLQMVGSPFSSSFYFTNSIYLNYLVYIIDYVSRIIFTILFFSNGVVKIWTASFASDLVYICAFLFYILYCKRYVSKIKVSKIYFSLKHLLSILKSGIWFSISTTGNMMLSSLSSYFANILCGVFITGVFSAIMQLNIIENVVLNVLVNASTSKMFDLFSNDRRDDFLIYILETMTMVGLFIGIISGGIIVYGSDFMRFWMGPKFARYQLLIMMTVIYLPLTLPSQILNQSFSVMNKVKIPALVTIAFGILNILLAVILVKVVKLDIYGIVLAMMIVQSLRDILFYPYYFFRSGYRFTFKVYLPYLISAINLVFSVVSCLSIRRVILPDSLLNFSLSVVAAGGVAAAVAYIIWYLYRKYIFN